MPHTIIHVKPLTELPRTDEECPKCGEGNFVLDDHRKFCERCFYAPTRDANNVADEDQWVKFWTHRSAEYDGFRGPDRIKAVGGFAAAYTDWSP